MAEPSSTNPNPPSESASAGIGDRAALLVRSGLVRDNQRNSEAVNANYNDEFSGISIRGIVSTAGTSTTGIYTDEMPIQGRHFLSSGITPFPVLFDLDRVEVRRGPQGTLLGAGAEGGVMRFISPPPSLTQNSGYVPSEIATTKSGDPSYELGAAAGGRVIYDVLGFRVSASYRREGGWVDRVTYTTAPNPANLIEPTPVSMESPNRTTSGSRL